MPIDFVPLDEMSEVGRWMLMNGLSDDGGIGTLILDTTDDPYEAEQLLHWWEDKD